MGIQQENNGQEIAKKAYELWEKGGCLPGKEVEYWLEAEQIVLLSTSEEKGTPKARTKKADSFEKIPVAMKKVTAGEMKKESTEKKAPARRTAKKTTSIKETTKSK